MNHKKNDSFDGNQNKKVDANDISNNPTPLTNLKDLDKENSTKRIYTNQSENVDRTKKPKIDTEKKTRKLSVLLALLPLLVLACMIYFLTSPYGQNLITKGTPLPEISIEKIEFHEDQIVAYIRNTGPEEVTISQADVNDRIHSAAIEPSQVLPRLGAAKVIIPFLWNPAEPYEIGITTSDGTRFSDTVDAAAPAPIPNTNQVMIFALLGVFVGVIPVLIGLAWYPFLRKITSNQYNFFMSLTAGLLIFLGIDAFLESNEIATENLAPVFNAQILIPVIIISTFLGLYFISEHFVKKAEQKISRQEEKNLDIDSSTAGITREKERQKSASNSISDEIASYPKTEETTRLKESLGEKQTSKMVTSNTIIRSLAISLMISIGIGLHNFGEGLAIGAAMLLGQIALSTFLIIGFTIHNTTEGLAIVAPIAKTGKLRIKRLILMGLIAGIPTILGTWIGGFVYSPIASVIFLSIGAGAIFQVVFSLIVWMAKSFRKDRSKESFVSGETNISNKNTLQVDHQIQRDSNAGLSITAGLIVGMMIMYLTGLLV